jgi:integration host factor subunit beta
MAASFAMADGVFPESRACDPRPHIHKVSRKLPSMTKSELIAALAERQKHLAFADVELAVRNVIEQMSAALARGDRIEIRGFGSFSLHYRPPRTGRNPKTGTAVALPGKYVPHFKPGKELRQRVNEGGAE